MISESIRNRRDHRSEVWCKAHRYPRRSSRASEVECGNDLGARSRPESQLTNLLKTLSTSASATVINRSSHAGLPISTGQLISSGLTP